MKTIVVIGANSALAQTTIPILQQENKVITAGKKNCDIYCDITKTIEFPRDTDIVINFAAAFGRTGDKAALETVATNVLGTLKVCMAAKKADAKQVILLSSMSAVLEETSPYYTSYAITKRQGDELAQYYCRQNNLPLAILRPSQIYGDDDSFSKNQPFFYQMIAAAQKGEDITVYGRHDARRNYIHALDLTHVIVRVAEHSVTGVYPCLYPEDTSFEEIARTAQRTFAKGGEVVFLEDKPDIPDNVFRQDPAIYEKIKYRPQVSLAAGIQRIQVYRKGRMV